MIFKPQIANYEDSQEIIKLNIGKEKISALYLPNSTAKYTILYSHGNAEDLGDIRPILESLKSSGYSVFAYDYRGYGTSEGKPSERNTYQDINAAYNYLTQELKISPNNIIVYGRSVGGGVAVDLASRQPVGGLVMESAFITAFRVVTKIPLFPFDKFRNIDKIKRVQCPVLVLHGTADEIIPLWHGQELFAAVNQPKQSFWIEAAGHNDLIFVAGSRYPKIMQDFLKFLNQNNK